FCQQRVLNGWNYVAQSARCGEDHEAVLAHVSLPSWWHKNGGFKGFDHQRTGRSQPGVHARSVIDCGVNHSGFAKPRGTSGFERVYARRPRRVANGKGWNGADRRDTNADDLHRLGSIIMAVRASVQLMEALLDLGEYLAINRSARDAHQQLVGLPRVARVHETFETAARGRNARTVKHGRSFLLDRLE